MGIIGRRELNRAKDVTGRDVAELRRKVAWLPLAEDVRFAFWSRGGAPAGHEDVWSFGPEDVVRRTAD